MKAVQRFIKENGWISALFLVSILIIILYMYSLEKTEWFPHAGDWFNVVFQISVGYIVSFIFYITQVYIPERRNRENINRCICIEIDRILMRVEELFSHIDMNHVIKGKFTEASDEQLLVLLQSLKTDNRVSVLNPRRAYNPNNIKESEFTVKEWIISRIEFIEGMIDGLRKYYPQYVTPELTNALDAIVYSQLHQSMCRVQLQIPTPMSYAECKNESFFWTYRDAINNLIECKKQYEV